MADPAEDVIDAEATDVVSPADDIVPAPRAARRAPSPLSRHYGADSPLAPAIDALERQLGGRAALLESLMGLPDAAGLDYVVGLLADPTSDSRKLSAICHAGGISVGELLEAVKRGKLLAPTLRAMTHVADRIPAVVEDVMTRSTQHYVPCASCAGTGSLPGSDLDKPPEPCRACRATGQVLRQPDLATQEVALRLAGLGPKSQPGVAINVDNRKQMAIGSMSDLIRDTDAVALRPKPRVQNAAASPADPAVDSLTEPPAQ